MRTEVLKLLAMPMLFSTNFQSMLIFVFYPPFDLICYSEVLKGERCFGIYCVVLIVAIIRPRFSLRMRSLVQLVEAALLLGFCHQNEQCGNKT